MSQKIKKVGFVIDPSMMVPVSTEIMAKVREEMGEEAWQAEQNLVWCECDNDEAVTFYENNQCSCSVKKHHYHCQNCEGITQIG